MPIYKGSGNNPGSIYAKSSSIGEVYVGQNLVWQKYVEIFHFDTNSPNETSDHIFTVSIDAGTKIWKWNLGDGTILKTNSVSHNYDDSTLKTVRAFYPSSQIPKLTALGFDTSDVVGEVDLSMFTEIEELILMAGNNPEFTGFIFNSGLIGSLLLYFVVNNGITGTLDLSMFTELSENYPLDSSHFQNVIYIAEFGVTEILFPGSGGITGGLQQLAITSGVSDLNLSCFEEIQLFQCFIQNNSSLTEILFAPTITGSLYMLYIKGNGLTGTLDLSMFTEIEEWQELYPQIEIQVTNNPNLTEIIFAPAITGDYIRNLYLNDNNLTGTLDVSGFTQIRALDFNASNNPNLTEVVFAASITNYTNAGPYIINISNCDLQTSIDLSGFTISEYGSSLSIILNNNADLEEIIFPAYENANTLASLLNISYCNFSGTLDLSSERFSQYIVNNNSALTGITLKTNGGFYLFIANDCDLGYIDFSTQYTDYPYLDVQLQNNNMTAAEVNHILYDLDGNMTGSNPGGSINIAGTNAAPDSSSGGYDGLAAKTSLQGKGVTVTTN